MLTLGAQDEAYMCSILGVTVRRLTERRTNTGWPGCILNTGYGHFTSPFPITLEKKISFCGFLHFRLIFIDYMFIKCRKTEKYFVSQVYCYLLLTI
jgi:hypothetical protein